jgi:hypothetical protein
MPWANTFSCGAQSEVWCSLMPQTNSFGAGRPTENSPCARHTWHSTWDPTQWRDAQGFGIPGHLYGSNSSFGSQSVVATGQPTGEGMAWTHMMTVGCAIRNLNPSITLSSAAPSQDRFGSQPAQRLERNYSNHRLEQSLNGGILGVRNGLEPT